MRGSDLPVFLVGRRYELNRVSPLPPELVGANFVEFSVLHESEVPAEWTTHRLAQHENVPYSDGEFREYDVLPARSIKNPASLCLTSPPVWKTEAALWPTELGQPMMFVGQVTVVENEVAKACFTWDISVFLFHGAATGQHRFQVVTQDLLLQTASEHYRSESRRSRMRPQRA